MTKLIFNPLALETCIPNPDYWAHIWLEYGPVISIAHH